MSGDVCHECCECRDRGWLYDQGYGGSMWAPGWVPVQACDQCSACADDEAAALAAAAAEGTVCAYFPPAPRDDPEDELAPGDWHIFIGAGS